MNRRRRLTVAGRAALAAAAAALALPAAGADPARAAFPGGNGGIAFVGKRAGKDVLYVREGRRYRRLPVRGTLADPTFSPHGVRLAFARASSTGWDIWVMQADGADRRRITTPGGRAVEPAWSPAGDELVFAAGSRRQRDLYVIGADGLELRPLVHGRRDQHAPAWSSRGAIAYVQRGRRGDDIYVIAAENARPRRVAGRRLDETAPAWSPDGRRLAFVAGPRGRRDVWIADADGSDRRRVTRLGGHLDAPAFSPNGRRLVFSAGLKGKRRLYSIRPSGRGLRALSLPSSDGRSPDWQPRGTDPIVAAAGDIACDPDGENYVNGDGVPNRCGQQRTSDLLLRMDLAAVLVAGDTQYEDGSYGKFLQVFNPTWGRVKSLLRPVPGNHEYRIPGAAGYFDYFNGVGEERGPAGHRRRGFYSFDVGKWHVVALNSNCEPVAGCHAGSPQERWLRADLAKHRARCTLAFWHHPRFSSADLEEDRRFEPLWRTLYAAGADVVVNGHDHFYERFAPQDADGAYRRDGMRQFIVGTGGKSIRPSPFGQDPNSEALDSTSLGVLRLTLRPRSYDWQFMPETPDGFTDAGGGRCR